MAELGHWVFTGVGRPSREMEATMLMLLLELTACKSLVCACFFRLHQGLAPFPFARSGQL